MNGNEQFIYQERALGFDMKDFWSFQYSNIYILHGEIAEFIVARALGVTDAQNSEYWTLWDVSYREKRIEVKASGCYHLWNNNDNISSSRVFSIAKANGAYDYEKSGNKEFKRQNDIYVFCLNKGKTAEESYPLNLDNWEFYVVPTTFLDEHCGNQKTISLGRIQHFGFEAIGYDKLRGAIDNIIDKTTNSR